MKGRAIKPKHIISLAVFALFAAFAAFALRGVFSSADEPVYGGKPLSVWLTQLQDPHDRAAAEAILQIGSKALPFLLEEFHPRDYYKQKAIDTARFIRPSYQVAYVRTNTFARKMAAAHAIGILGQSAQPLRKELQTLSEGTGDYSTWLAYSALVFTNTPSLLFGLTNSDANIQNLALSHVWFFRQRNLLRAADTEVFPVVTNLFSERSGKAFSAVLSFGPLATNALPALSQFTNDPQKTTRERAVWTMRQIKLKASSQ